MLLTVLRPGRYPEGYQFGSKDYVAVSHLDVRGSVSVGDACRFTAGPSTDPRNIELFQQAFKARSKAKWLRRG